MVHIFDFFINGNWLFESQNIYNVLNRMSPEEQLEFECDPQKIDWQYTLYCYIKGLQIFVMNEDHVAPIHGL